MSEIPQQVMLTEIIRALKRAYTLSYSKGDWQSLNDTFDKLISEATTRAELDVIYTFAYPMKRYINSWSALRSRMELNSDE